MAAIPTDCPQWPLLIRPVKAQNGRFSLRSEWREGPTRYFRDNLTPYIDVSPGAFAPLRFTSDNKTLAPGETTWDWPPTAGMLCGVRGETLPTFLPSAC
jgi:hypothetical protein